MVLPSGCATASPATFPNNHDSEKCESALASTIEMRGLPSTPWSEAVWMSNALCCTTRAAYAVCPTVTAWVLQCSVCPLDNAQSNTISGVSTTACSLRSEMACMNDIYRGGMVTHARRRNGERVVAQSRGFIDAPRCTWFVFGRSGLRLCL